MMEPDSVVFFIVHITESIQPFLLNSWEFPALGEFTSSLTVAELLFVFNGF